MNAIQINPKKEKTISKRKQSPQLLHIIIIIIFIFTKHKGKQKPYLKENRGHMGFKIEVRKCYLESAFNHV